MGLHTNGYSLARRVAERSGRTIAWATCTLADALLAPHRSYLAELQAAFAIPGVRDRGAHHRRWAGGEPAAGAAGWHWPPSSTSAHGRCRRSSRRSPPKAAVDDAEMYRVFNMGLGLVFVVAAEATSTLLEAIPDARVVGRIVERTGPAVILARA